MLRLTPSQVSQSADHWTDAMQYAGDEAGERAHAAWERAAEAVDLDDVLASLLEGTSREEQAALVNHLFVREAQGAKPFYRVCVEAKDRAVRNRLDESLAAETTRCCCDSDRGDDDLEQTESADNGTNDIQHDATQAPLSRMSHEFESEMLVEPFLIRMVNPLANPDHEQPNREQNKCSVRNSVQIGCDCEHEQ